MAHLARTISWYRHLTAIEQSTQGPADMLARDSAQRTAKRALQLAFDFARATAPLANAGQPAARKESPTTARIEQVAAQAIQRITTVEGQLAEVDAAMGKAGAQKRATLVARRKELLAELALAKEINESVRGLRTFMSSQTAGGDNDLLGVIERLERSVPEALRGTQPPAAVPPPPSLTAASDSSFRPESAGIFALASETIQMIRSRKQLNDALAETDALRAGVDQLRAPLVADLTGAIRRSDAATSDSASQDVQQIDSDRREIEAITLRFRQVSSALAPLREHRLQIETARGSLIEQRNAVQQRYNTAGSHLLFRVLGLIVTIAVLLAISELWRRGTFRYVQDARRRKQFLLLRRVVVSFVVAVTVVMGLVNEMGSLATYAGFLTAGLAVALQNVIVSIVAYFFLIGRYGLRVGDRVTISGVTGDVVELGLVRIYLMEMTGNGTDLHATGRVVGFSNSVLFQPMAMFRQMPGTDYVWHTVSVTLSPDNDPQVVETRLMTAVESVYEKYRDRIVQQHAAFQRMVDLPVSPPKPEGRLRFTDAGLEFLVRYPAEMRRGSETDDQVVNALSRALVQEPRLTLANSGAPKVQAA